MTQLILIYMTFYPMPIFLRIFNSKLSEIFLFSNRSSSVNIWARKMFVFFCFFLTGQNFVRNWLVMLSVSYTGKNAYSAGKTSGVFRVGASGANRCYVLAHCGGGGMRGQGMFPSLSCFFSLKPSLIIYNDGKNVFTTPYTTSRGLAHAHIKIQPIYPNFEK